MATKMRKTRTSTKKTRAKLWNRILGYTPEEKLRIWRQFSGILKGKGPKNVEAWQRKLRKDRKII